jgi:hypothetical protein
MVHRPPPNCQHLDNWRACRIMHGQLTVLKWLGVRPACVLDNPDPPRDGDWTCDEQKPFPRPAGPPPMPGKR